MKPQTFHFKLAQILTHTMKALSHADTLKKKKQKTKNPFLRSFTPRTKILSCKENILNHANERNASTLDTTKEREAEVRSENNSQQFRSHEKRCDTRNSYSVQPWKGSGQQKSVQMLHFCRPLRLQM